MANLVIRDLSDEVLHALSQQAANLGISREKLIRMTLEARAAEATPPRAYEIRFASAEESPQTMGRIVRRPNGSLTGSTLIGGTAEQNQAFEDAKALAHRNYSGDHEQIMKILLNLFPEVVESPMPPPDIETRELGVEFSDSDWQYLLRTDGALFRRLSARDQWKQVDMPTEISKAIYGVYADDRSSIENLRGQLARMRQKFEEYGSSPNQRVERTGGYGMDLVSCLATVGGQSESWAIRSGSTTIRREKEGDDAFRYRTQIWSSSGPIGTMGPDGKPTTQARSSEMSRLELVIWWLEHEADQHDALRADDWEVLPSQEEALD